MKEKKKKEGDVRGAALLEPLSFHRHNKYASYTTIKLLLNSWKIANLAALVSNK